MTITYEFEDNLYVNTTNRCTCACEFCLRTHGDSVGNSGSLWLNREPGREEILTDIKARDLSRYKELVFCGYGEPTYRLFDILWICSNLKENYDIPIRMDTNGHGSMIHEQNIAPCLQGLIDRLSVSLNAATAEDYVRRCHPTGGQEAYRAMLEFTREAVRYVPYVQMTVVNTIPADEIEACRKIAEGLGATFRVREYIES